MDAAQIPIRIISHISWGTPLLWFGLQSIKASGMVALKARLKAERYGDLVQ